MYSYQIWKYPNWDSGRHPKDRAYLWLEDTGDVTVVGTLMEAIQKIQLLSNPLLVTKVVIEEVK